MICYLPESYFILTFILFFFFFLTFILKDSHCLGGKDQKNILSKPPPQQREVDMSHKIDFKLKMIKKKGQRSKSNVKEIKKI